MLQTTAARRASGLGGADVRLPIGPSSADAFPQCLPQAVEQLGGQESLEAAGAGERHTIVVPTLTGASASICRARRLINLLPAASPEVARSLGAPEGAG